MRIIMEKEDEALKSSGRVDINESDPATEEGYKSSHKLEYYEDDLLHKQIDFWQCMFRATLTLGIRFPADPRCDLEAWFNEKIRPLITKDFGSSSRVEQAQFLGRLGIKCLERLQYLMPLNLVSQALMFDDGSLRARVKQGVLTRETMDRKRALASH